MFGRTPATQHECYLNECRAYYTFIHPSDIKSRENMTPLFHGSSLLHNGDWLESANLI